MNKREKFIIWTLVTILALELTILFLLVYLARIEAFFLLFLSAIRIVSPVFLLANIVFLLSNFFVRGRELAINFWKIYLRDFIRFLIVSFIITVTLVTVSALLGALIGISLKKVYSFPTIRTIIEYLREWVARQFY